MFEEVETKVLEVQGNALDVEMSSMRWREEDLSRKDVQSEPNGLYEFASYDQGLTKSR
jgi:hypothetical protein